MPTIEDYLSVLIIGLPFLLIGFGMGNTWDRR